MAGPKGEAMSRPHSKLAYWVLLFAILLNIATPGPARAEDPAPPSPWSFQIVPYLWLVGIGGDISGGAIYDVSSLAFDPDGHRLFFTTNN